MTTEGSVEAVGGAEFPPTSQGIHSVQVQHVGKAGSAIRRALVEFGPKCAVELTCQEDRILVRIEQAGLGVHLSIGGKTCDLQRAINLLRLHMPGCRQAGGR